MPKALTVPKSRRTDDDFAIDATGEIQSDQLKSLCLAWHDDATGTIPTLVPGQTLNIPVLRSSLIARSSSIFDSHLIVSEQIFGELRAAWNANFRLKFDITHQASVVICSCLAPASQEECDPSLVAIAETVQSTHAKVMLIEQAVSAIQADIALIKSALTDEGQGLGDTGDHAHNGKGKLILRAGALP